MGEISLGLNCSATAALLLQTSTLAPLPSFVHRLVALVGIFPSESAEAPRLGQV